MAITFILAHSSLAAVAAALAAVALAAVALAVELALAAAFSFVKPFLVMADFSGVGLAFKYFSTFNISRLPSAIIKLEESMAIAVL